MSNTDNDPYKYLSWAESIQYLNNDKSKLNNKLDILYMTKMLIYGSESVSHKIKLIQVKPHQK